MHRMTPLTSAFVGYTSGGARALVDAVTDNPMMQEMKGNFMKKETRQDIEAPQNYGFTSVVLPATKGKDGQIEAAAEAFISFIGGNRSFPVAAMMDDRRHRPMGLKPGENAQYDDIGQMTLLRRLGMFILSLDSKDEKTGNMVERMVSLRHVEKKKQERPKLGGTSATSTSSSSSSSAPSAAPNSATRSVGVEQQAAQTQDQQQQQSKEDFKHEGESVNTEIRCTKSRIEFRSGDTVVGYYDKGQDTWFFKGKIVTLESSQRIETVGKTYLGLDSKGESPPLKDAAVGDIPAKQVWLKTE